MRIDGVTLGRIKQAISFAVLLPELGFELPRKTSAGKGRTRCAKHGGENPLAFSFDEGKGRFKCFGCGARGDKIEFVRWSLGLSFPQAVRWLADRTGAPLHPEDRKLQQARVRARAESVAQGEQLAIFAELKAADLRAERNRIWRQMGDYRRSYQNALDYVTRHSEEADHRLTDIAWAIISFKTWREWSAAARRLDEELMSWEADDSESLAELMRCWEQIQSAPERRNYWSARISREIAERDALARVLWEGLHNLSERDTCLH